MTARSGHRIALSLFFVGAGGLHFRATDAFAAIVPDWTPYPREIVIATGALEVIAGLALLVPKLRWWAGIVLATYAVAVFPANIKHAFDPVVLPPLPDSWWYHAPRLALQPVIVWLCLYAAEIIDWPWRRHDEHERKP